MTTACQQLEEVHSDWVSLRGCVSCGHVGLRDHLAAGAGELSADHTVQIEALESWSRA